MNKKITIEVPADWGDEDMGGYSGAELVNEVQGLVREQSPGKYREWQESVRPMKNIGYLEENSRKLARAAPDMVDLLVQMKRRLTHAAGVELLEDLGVNRVLRLAFPHDVADEVLDLKQEPYDLPLDTQCEAFTGIGAGPRCRCQGVWRYRVTDYKGEVTMEILCGTHYRQRRGDHCVRNIEHTGRKLA
jgi:hypothetical protein